MMKSGTRLRDVFKMAAVPLLATTVALAGSYGFTQATRQEFEGVKITQTESRFMRKGDGLGIHKTIYKTEQGDFQNTWSPLHGKFSNGEMEAQLKVGETYDITVVGLHIPVLGKYPNAISVKPSTPKPPGK